MNSAQRNLLFVAASIIFLMTLFPPFLITLRAGVFNQGYAFILTPPQWGDSVVHGTINATLFLVQWVAVIMIAGLLYFALAMPNTSTTKCDLNQIEPQNQDGCLPGTRTTS